MPFFSVWDNIKHLIFMEEETSYLAIVHFLENRWVVDANKHGQPEVST